MKRTVLFHLLIILIGTILLSGCNMMPSNADGKSVSNVGKKMEIKKDISGLTCFQCHPYERFKSVFPHDNHRAMGLHCTQCHIVEGHKMATLNAETCNHCHNLRVMELSTTVMPVKFNHEGHSAMFECKKCHKGLFPMKVNARKISMDALQQGKYCGKCHDGKMAFSSTECQRCHEM